MVLRFPVLLFLLLLLVNFAYAIETKPQGHCAARLGILEENKILVREHRGALQESLETATIINRTPESLAALIQDRLKVPIAPSNVHVSRYGFDERIGWDTYIITVEGLGVFGFSDGPLVTLH